MRSVALTTLLLAAAAAPGGAVETLDDAWAVAVVNNAALTASRLRSEAARCDALAAASERLPSASLRSGYTHRSSEPSFLGSQPALGAPSFALPFAQRNAASFSAQATTPLWTGGRIENSVAAATCRHAASQEGARWAEMQLRMAVAQAYIDVLQRQATLSAASELHASAQAEAADVAEQARQRRATDTQVMASRVAALRAEQQVRVARHALSSGEAAYNWLLGRPPRAPVELAEPNVVPWDKPLEEITAIATANRPDLAEARRTVQAYQRDAAGWRAARLPQVSAEVGFDYEQNRFQSPEGIGSAGVFVDWKVLDGGGRRRRSSAAAHQASAARAALQDLEAEIAVEVLNAWNGRDEARGAEQVSADALAHHIEHHRLIQQRESHGVVVAAQGLAARAALAEAHALYRHAHTSRLLADLRLRFVAGMLGQECH